jgi:hypothetical protein
VTLPDERYRAITYTRKFLLDLCDTRSTKGIPKEIRDRARSCLRHFPSDWELDQAADAAPHVFQREMEAVTRLFAQYEQKKTANE